MKSDGYNLRLALAAFCFAGMIGFTFSGGFSGTVRAHEPDCKELAAALARAEACCKACEVAKDVNTQSR
jgi:hypothetical protein